MLARLIALTFSALMLAPAPPLGAQSLADLARQEAERRKDASGTTKVITNKDLPGGGGTAAPAAAAPKTASDGQTSKAAGKTDSKTAEASGTKGKDDETVKDEKYWAGRKKDLDEQLARDQIYADALQSRINALTTDFVNRDDPAQRTKIANDRQKSIDEMERLKTTIAADKKAIVDFQEEARRAGVPPGWLR